MEPLVVDFEEREGRVVVVVVRGEVRLEAKELSGAFTQVIARQPKDVVLDLSGLVFISSLGMGAIVALRNALKRSGGRVIVCGTRPLVMDAFKRARLTDLFGAVCDNVDAGMQIVKS